jgi:hypothetical protein
MVDLETLQALYEKWGTWPQSDLRNYELCERLKDEWPALRDELLAARKDAERYRWLKERRHREEANDRYPGYRWWISFYDDNMLGFEQFIDAVMKT